GGEGTREGSRSQCRLAARREEVAGMPAYYRATLAEFLADEPQRILGVLASRSAPQGFTDLKQRQTRAWERQITALRNTSTELTARVVSSARWSVLLEDPIPRRAR